MFEHIAVGIHLQGEGVLDAWISRIALVVIGDGLERVAEEHPMTIQSPPLQNLDGEVLLAHRVGVRARSISASVALG